jgi:hypothetical protein
MYAYIGAAVAVFLVAFGITARSWANPYYEAMAAGLESVGIAAPSWESLSYGTEFLVLSAALALIVFAKYRKAHERWLEYSFLAERLRSAIFLAVCGLEASRIELSSHIFTAGDTTDWPERVFEEIRHRFRVTEPCSGGSCRVWADYVATQWLDNQIRYHQKTAKSAARWTVACEWGGLCAFILAMAAAAAHCLHKLPDLSTFLAIGLPGISSTLAGIQSHRESSRISKRSENMVKRLTYLKRRLIGTVSIEELEKVLRETEEIMVHEAQEWMIVMRFAELQAHT